MAMKYLNGRWKACTQNIRLRKGNNNDDDDNNNDNSSDDDAADYDDDDGKFEYGKKKNMNCQPTIDITKLFS